MVAFPGPNRLHPGAAMENVLSLGQIGQGKGVTELSPDLVLDRGFLSAPPILALVTGLETMDGTSLDTGDDTSTDQASDLPITGTRREKKAELCPDLVTETGPAPAPVPAHLYHKAFTYTPLVTFT